MKSYPVIRPYDAPRKPIGFRMSDFGIIWFILFATALLSAMTMGREDQKTASGYYDAQPKVMTPARMPEPVSPSPAKPTARQLATEAATAEGIKPALLHGLIQSESGGKQSARSRKGAIGATQLMPRTARELGVDPHDAAQNIRGGALYLKRTAARYRDETLGLVAYNMGPGATDRWLAKGGHWHELPKETRDYVSKVKINAALVTRRTQLADNR